VLHANDVIRAYEAAILDLSPASHRDASK